MHVKQMSTKEKILRLQELTSALLNARNEFEKFVNDSEELHGKHGYGLEVALRDSSEIERELKVRFANEQLALEKLNG